jgi:hypothetical protein
VADEEDDGTAEISSTTYLISEGSYPKKPTTCSLNKDKLGIEEDN